MAIRMDKWTDGQRYTDRQTKTCKRMDRRPDRIGQRRMRWHGMATCRIPFIGPLGGGQRERPDIPVVVGRLALGQLLIRH
jgi:hypothetical protein